MVEFSEWNKGQIKSVLLIINFFKKYTVLHDDINLPIEWNQCVLKKLYWKSKHKCLLFAERFCDIVHKFL